MHHKKKLLLLLIIVLGLIVNWSGYSQAASGIIYLSSSSSSVEIGNEITESLRINPSGSPVDSVQATVNFSSAQLEFVSATFGSTFSQFENTPGSGNVTLVGTVLGGGSVSSDSLIATITFKALVSSGSDALTVTSANAAYQGSYTNPSPAGTTINFTAPPVTVTPTTTTTTTVKKTTTNTTSSTTTTTPVTTPVVTPVVAPAKASLDIGSLAVQFSQANLTVSSNIPVQLSVSYGTSSDQLNQNTPYSSLAKSSTLDFGSSTLTPGTTYYYEVVAKDANGNYTTSSVKTLTTKGLTINVTVLDGDNNPLANKQVALHSTAATTTHTNAKGIATFSNITPGMHSLSYSASKQTYSANVYVDNNVSTKGTTQTAPPQNAAVILTGYKPTVELQIRVLIIILSLLIILGMFMTVFETPLIKNIKDKIKLAELQKIAKKINDAKNKTTAAETESMKEALITPKGVTDTTSQLDQGSKESETDPTDQKPPESTP